MKRVALLLVFGLSTAFMYAQSALVPVGGDAQNNSGSVSYTVGQVAASTVTNNDGSISVAEGVQQPYEIMVVGVNHYPEITLNAKVYPNPTENLAQLELNGFEIPNNGLQAFLYDGNGKLLQTIKITDDLTTFQIGHYATGNYLLELKSGSQTLKTFKVVRK
jgi:hypothetical protein